MTKIQIYYYAIIEGNCLLIKWGHYMSCFTLVRKGCFCLLLVGFSSGALAAAEKAPVSGFARSFLLGMKLANADITVLETGQKLKTDSLGHFGPFQYPIGKKLTLEFSKWGYKSTQSATVTVPRDGLESPYDNITFQIPSIESYYLLSAIVGAKIDKNSCHLTATVTGYHKTMDEVPQGEEGVTVSLIPETHEIPFYFGIYTSGPLKNKTNPFAKGLRKTSEDGGVAYFNLPPSDKPYTLVAHKNGMSFTNASFLCQKGKFINISPPRGPMALNQH